MSAALPKSLEISYRKAGTWLQRCFLNGGGAWCFLSRVLRVYYGVIVCGGNHEPLLDLRTNLYVMLEKLIPARNFIHLGKIAASLLILAEVEIITNGYFN